MEAKVKTLTAQGRMQAIVLGGLPFFLGVALSYLNPELMEPLFKTPRGSFILFLAAICWMVGIYLITRKVRVSIDI
ncbi:MAG: hypothetical protein MZV63_63505 [Marinilabiliales bacterium]|nr:hypothetical protein [Marinilabiliales bacterium]